MSADAILNIVEIAHAIRMGALGATQKELAAEFGCSVEKVVRSLSAVGVRLQPKPFGTREVTIRLSLAEVAGLKAVAARQRIRGSVDHAQVLEQAGRRLGAEPDLLQAVIDPTLRPVFVDGDDPHVWMRLGEAASQANHIAGVPLAPEIAAKMHRLFLAKGARATTAIEGNTLTEKQVEAQVDGTLSFRAEISAAGSTECFGYLPLGHGRTQRPWSKAYYSRVLPRTEPPTSQRS